jgi:hypothetical protein
MQRFKVLGLNVTAILAISVVTASAASGAEFHSSSGTTFLTGSQVQVNEFAVNGGSFKCTTATASGSQVGLTAKEITLTPHYTGCTAFGQTIHVDLNGCTYRFTAASATAGNTVVACPAGKEILFTVGTPSVICTVAIKAQTPFNNLVDYKSEGAKPTRDVLATATVGTLPVVKGAKSGIAYTTSGGICAEGGENGALRGSFTLRGYSDAKHSVLSDIFVE